ncbi:hypothetical protein [[Mycoplasma] phocae]|nr:hypothetical protein [[Mycoplasma] phocae]
MITLIHRLDKESHCKNTFIVNLKAKVWKSLEDKSSFVMNNKINYFK